MKLLHNISCMINFYFPQKKNLLQKKNSAFYLKGRKTNNRVLLHSPNAHDYKNWAMPKLSDRNYHWVPHVRGSNLTP